MTNFDGVNRSANHFTSHEWEPQPKKSRRKWRWFLIILILLSLVGFGAYHFLYKTNRIFTGNKNIFQRIGSLLISPDKKLIGEEEGHVNILLMGVGGPGHEGPLLTDTMIVANINIVTHEVVLISIPRDFMVKLPTRGLQKINAVYAYAEQDDEKTGGAALLTKMEELTGLTIPYYAVIDFKGFVKAVNDVGGVDITVERTFTDSSYPDYNNGFLAPVTFTKGTDHMNGERALIFARSRKGNNGEGSDFARSERQKKILLALKEKALSLNFNDLKTLNNLLNSFTENFRTNMEPYELKRLADSVSGITENAVYSFSLDPDSTLICDGLIDLATGKPPVPILVEPDEDEETTPTPTPTPPSTSPPAEPGVEEEEAEPETVNPPTTAYVVIPCNGKTLADIHEFLKNSTFLAKLGKESAVVEIQNSTGKTGLAASIFGGLVDQNIDAKFTTFLGKVPYDQTILYDNSHGSKPNTLEYLKSNYELTTSDVNYTASTADFVIVLGKDSL